MCWLVGRLVSLIWFRLMCFGLVWFDWLLVAWLAGWLVGGWSIQPYTLFECAFVEGTVFGVFLKGNQEQPNHFGVLLF